MKPRKNVVLIGGVFALMTFLLFYFGVAFALEKDVVLMNLVAYGVFSLIVWVVVSLFASFSSKIGLIIFIIAYAIGFGTMIYTFSSDLTGWEDLVGLLQMMMTLGIGLVLGILIEAILYFINKSKQKKLIL